MDKTRVMNHQIAHPIWYTVRWEFLKPQDPKPEVPDLYNDIFLVLQTLKNSTKNESVAFPEMCQNGYLANDLDPYGAALLAFLSKIDRVMLILAKQMHVSCRSLLSSARH